MSSHHPDLTDEHRVALGALLERERTVLARQVARAKAAGPVQLDQTAVGRLSRMDALMNQGLSQGSEARAVEELGLIEDALQRLDRGTYGFCHSCRQPIALERLLVIPEARDCARCRAR